MSARGMAGLVLSTQLIQALQEDGILPDGREFTMPATKKVLSEIVEALTTPATLSAAEIDTLTWAVENMRLAPSTEKEIERAVESRWKLAAKIAKMLERFSAAPQPQAAAAVRPSAPWASTAELLEDAAISTPQPQPAALSGFALVPLRLTPGMDRVLQEEDWDWTELLAAAEAITQDQYAELQSAPQVAAAAPAEGYEHHRAIMEAERHESLKRHISARPLGDSGERVYEAGFANGWDRRAALATSQLSNELKKGE